MTTLGVSRRLCGRRYIEKHIGSTGVDPRIWPLMPASFSICKKRRFRYPIGCFLSKLEMAPQITG
jgi:hypothetical protein